MSLADRCELGEISVLAEGEPQETGIGLIFESEIHDDYVHIGWKESYITSEWQTVVCGRRCFL